MCVFLLDREVEAISHVIADVEDWQGLADWLSIGRSSIEEGCARSNSPAMCYRHELVRLYCNKLSSHSSKITEDIAHLLERMDHKRQAEQLRQLNFGKSRSNPPG